MRAMALDLARQGIGTDGFIKLLDGYQQRRFEAEADPEAPSGLAAFMTETAVRVGLHAAHAVPGVGGLADVADPDALAAQADQLRVFLGKKFRRHEDVRLLLSPLVVLTPALVGDLAQAARQRPLALFFDAYEQTGPVLDGWLRSMLDGAHGELPENLVVTVAGRNPLAPDAWSAYLPVIADVPLKPFTDAEAEQFLAERGITDSRVTQVIISVSGRLPLLLATLAENHPDDPDLVGDPSGSAVERFLKWETDSTRRAIAVAGALPRIIDEDVLSILATGAEHPRELFAWLRSLPFVTDNAGRCQYHNVVRTAMVRLERGQSPGRWREHHQALAAAYHAWRIERFPRDSWDDPAWRALLLEETYHLVCAAPGPSRALALSNFVRACAERRSSAARFAQAITQAGEDTDAGTVQACGQRLEGALRQDGGNAAMVACLDIILAETDLPANVLPLALRTRGRALYFLDRETEALPDLTKAITLAPEDAKALAYRGDAHLWLEHFVEALEDFDRAIQLNPSDELAIASRGETYQRMGRFDEALADFSRAIELNAEYEWAIGSRGETYRLMGRFDEALADFSRAIELNAEYDWAIGSRGETYRLMGRFDEALADFSRAIKLDAEYEWAIGSRAQTYRLMGRYDEALADFSRAIKLNAEYEWAIASRGETYRLIGRYDEALADFSRAIKLNAEYDWAIASRGETYRLIGRFDEALADFSRAIELDAEYDWAIVSRAQTYRLMGRFDEALADFSRAIELDAEYDWAIASRGETYRLMGRFDEALNDLDRAIELNPGNDSSHYLKALIFLGLLEKPRAVHHLEIAIELARKFIRESGQPTKDSYNLVVYLAAADRFDEASDQLAAAVANYPKQLWMSEAIVDLSDLSKVPEISIERVGWLVQMLQDGSKAYS